VTRWLLPLAGAALMAAFGALYYLAPDAYWLILTGWGIDPFRFPFLDAHAVVAAIECKRLGYDVYVANPCDVLTRAHVYSPIFLEAAAFPISVDDRPAFGIALALGFFLAFASLPQPRDRFGWRMTGLAFFSTMVIFAIERGNNDLMIFVMVAAIGHLLVRSWRARWLAYALILAAGLLKYYPLTLLIVALREKPRAFIAVAVATMIAVALFIVHYRAELALGVDLVPTGSYFTDFFGAVNLPRGMTKLLSPLVDFYPPAAPVFVALPWVILAALLATTAQRLVAIAAQPATGEKLASLSELHRLFLVMGAMAIVACFFMAQSIGYRGIFFLMMLPALLLMERRGLVYMILFLMWGELFREALQHIKLGDGDVGFAWQAVKTLFWLVREFIWWRVIASLGAILVTYAIQSEIGGALLARFVPLRRAVR